MGWQCAGPRRLEIWPRHFDGKGLGELDRKKRGRQRLSVNDPIGVCQVQDETAMLVPGGGHILCVRSPSQLDFMEIAHDIATYMDQTGLDPFTVEEVQVTKGLHDRKMQRASMQIFEPKNDFLVREALL